MQLLLLQEANSQMLRVGGAMLTTWQGCSRTLQPDLPAMAWQLITPRWQRHVDRHSSCVGSISRPPSRSSVADDHGRTDAWQPTAAPAWTPSGWLGSGRPCKLLSRMSKCLLQCALRAQCSLPLLPTGCALQELASAVAEHQHSADLLEQIQGSGIRLPGSVPPPGSARSSRSGLSPASSQRSIASLPVPQQSMVSVA